MILLFIAILYNLESLKAVFLAELPKAILKETYKLAINIAMIVYLYNI